MYIMIQYDMKVYYINTDTAFPLNVIRELGINDLNHVIAIFKWKTLDFNCSVNVTSDYVTLSPVDKQTFNLVEVFQAVLVSSVVEEITEEYYNTIVDTLVFRCRYTIDLFEKQPKTIKSKK